MCFALTGLAVPLLRRSQFMDIPNHRSSHTRPVPRGGGVVVLATLLLVTLASLDLNAEVAGLLLATLLLGGIGFVDDLRSLPSGIRLLAQVGSALALGVVFLIHGGGSWWWLPVLMLAIAGYVNAFNFMDGVNGISGMTAVVIGGWWTWVGNDQGHESLYVLGIVLAGAALGFLPWNAPRARVFLGDVGSYGIGVFIVGLSALALTQGLPWIWALGPLIIYGADTGWVLLKRYRGGRPLTEAHREHVYQRLADAGYSHMTSAALCAGAAAVICVVVGAIGVEQTWWAIAIVGVVTVLYLNLPRLARSKEAVV